MHAGSGPGPGSSFAPTDISGCVLWLRADNSTLAALSDGAAVTTWPDESGVSHHLTQAGAANKPHYDASASPSCPYPTVQFAIDGSDVDYLASGAFTLDQPCTYFVVSLLGITGGTTILDGYPGYSPYLSVTGGQLKPYAGLWGPGITPTAPMIYTLVLNGASTVAALNGTYTSAVATGSDAPGGVVLGADGTFLVGGELDVAELIIYDSALGATNRGTVEDYLGAKYGVTVA